MSEIPTDYVLTADAEVEAALVANFTLSVFIAPLLIFLVEGQNITFRHLLQNCQRRKPVAAVLGYLIAMSVFSAIAGSIGYLLQLVLPYSLLTWATVIIFFAAGIIAILRYEVLWNKKKSKHEKPLLSNHGFGKNFVKCMWGPLKVIHIEITHKVVLCLAAIGYAPKVVIGAIFAYAALAILAALLGKKLREPTMKKIISITAGVALIAWGVMIYFFY